MPSLDDQSRQAGNRPLCPEEEKLFHDVTGPAHQPDLGQNRDCFPKPPQSLIAIAAFLLPWETPDAGSRTGLVLTRSCMQGIVPYLGWVTYPYPVHPALFFTILWHVPRGVEDVHLRYAFCVSSP